MYNYTKFYKNSFTGCFPSSTSLKLLVPKIDIFVDLTLASEVQKYKLPPTKTYINFPIADWSVPHDLDKFTAFIQKLLRLIKEKNILIHCKGGHGRSGIVVAILLSFLENLDGANAIAKTTLLHSQRKNLKLRYRLLGSPQTDEQRLFVLSFCKPLVFTSSSYLFPKIPLTSISEIEDHCKRRYFIDKNFRTQINSSISKIVFISIETFWGANVFGSGQNSLGKIYEKLRELN